MKAIMLAMFAWEMDIAITAVLKNLLTQNHAKFAMEQVFVLIVTGQAGFQRAMRCFNSLYQIPTLTR